MKIRNIQEKLIFLIFFFAPSGMFFISFFNLGSFRLFYIFCILYILYTMYINKIYSKKLILFGFAIFLLTLFSVIQAYYFGSDFTYKLNNHPLVRFIILTILFTSFYWIFANYISNRNYYFLYLLHKISLVGFFVVFILGLLIYIPALLGIINMSIWKSFVTVYQNAYGYIRFSPGTYPNEFGLLSSFFTILSIVFFVIEKKYKYILFALLFSIGIALASTRISYITFVFSLLLIFIYLYKNKNFIKINFIYITFMIISLILMKIYLNFDFISIVISGYNAIINNEGNSTTRLHDYKVATELFLETPYLGIGFESPHVSMMHSLQLQLFYGYGIIPFTVIIIILAIFIKIVRDKTYKSKFIYSLKSDKIYCKYFKLIFWVLFIHVFLFGLTNHNQAHFLTWLFFGHLLLKIKCKYNVGVFYEKTKIGNRF